jgi:hypothetical protein
MKRTKDFEINKASGEESMPVTVSMLAKKSIDQNKARKRQKGTRA